jgi:hypothetical protein
MRHSFSKIQRSEGGFSTVEILIAVAILVTTFSAVVTVVLGSQKMTVDTQTNNEALHGVEKLLESARATLRASFASSVVSSGPASTQLPDGTVVAHYYQTSLAQRDVSPCIKEITARYTWTVENRPQVIELATQVSDPSVPLGLGHECPTGGAPGGGGFAPYEYCESHNHADLNPGGNSGTDIAMFRHNDIRYAAITSQHASVPDDDFWIYDLTDIDNPEFRSRTNINTKGATALQVVKFDSPTKVYAYMLTDENSLQLRTYDITTVTAPQEKLKVTLPGNQAKTLYYFGGRLYVAVGSQLVILSLADPANPSITDTINLGGSIDINGIAVRNGYIYLATSDNNGEVKALNTSTFSPIHSFNAAGNNDGTSIFVSGGTVFLGRDSSGTVDDFYVLNGATPASGMPVLDSADLDHNNGGVIDIVVNGGLAFLASTDPNDEIEVWNVSDPRNIVKNCINTAAGNDDGVNLPNVASGLDFLDNIVFGSIRSNDALHIIIDPKHPPS